MSEQDKEKQAESEKEVEINLDDLDGFDVESDDEPEDELENDDDPGRDDEQDEDPVSEPDGDKEQEQEQEQEKTVPLKELLKERNKWKDRLNDPELTKARKLAERLKEATGKDYDQIMADLDATQVRNYVDNGVDQAVAQELVAIRRQNEEAMRDLRRRERDIEFEALKKNPLFQDIDLYRDEVELYAEGKKIPVKTAYLELYGEVIFEDMQRRVTQKVLDDSKKRQSKKVDTGETGQAKAQTKTKLTADEEAIAKMAGMSPAEYAAMKKIQTPDQYGEFKAKKK